MNPVMVDTVQQCACVCVHRPTSSKADVAEGEGGQGVGGAGASSEASQAQQQHQQFLGDTSLALPAFGSIETTGGPLPEGVNLHDVRTFEKLYKEHAEVGDGWWWPCVCGEEEFMLHTCWCALCSVCAGTWVHVCGGRKSSCCIHAGVRCVCAGTWVYVCVRLLCLASELPTEQKCLVYC